jgi:hypothetical protein
MVPLPLDKLRDDHGDGAVVMIGSEPTDITEQRVIKFSVGRFQYYQLRSAVTYLLKGFLDNIGPPA